MAAFAVASAVWVTAVLLACAAGALAVVSAGLVRRIGDLTRSVESGADAARALADRIADDAAGAREKLSRGRNGRDAHS